ncbi:MAG: hypothetical protein ACOYXC_19310, partial [Candidatus Rifleibacteriota bacterium]
ALIISFLLVTFLTGCGEKPDQTISVNGKKIEFDLSLLDSSGLRGSQSGKVSLSYEFSIPDNEESRRRVKEIDPGIQFMPGSRGRIGAGEGQCLCVGETGHKDFRRILSQLAALPFVERIIECHFE